MKKSIKIIIVLFLIALYAMTSIVYAEGKIIKYDNGKIHKIIVNNVLVLYKSDGTLDHIYAGGLVLDGENPTKYNVKIQYGENNQPYQLATNLGAIEFNSSGNVVKVAGDLKEIFTPLKADLAYFNQELGTYFETENIDLTGVVNPTNSLSAISKAIEQAIEKLNSNNNNNNTNTNNTTNSGNNTTNTTNTVVNNTTNNTEQNTTNTGNTTNNLNDIIESKNEISPVNIVDTTDNEIIIISHEILGSTSETNNINNSNTNEVNIIENNLHSLQLNSDTNNNHTNTYIYIIVGVIFFLAFVILVFGIIKIKKLNNQIKIKEK